MLSFREKKSNHHYIGALGEEIAKRYLEGKRYRTVAQNYRKKWGEIDIIMSYKKTIHFIEVKSVQKIIGYKRGESDRYRPEDNVHPFKVKRIYRAIESFFGDSRFKTHADKEWVIDLVSVYIDEEKKCAEVEVLENIF